MSLARMVQNLNGRRKRTYVGNSILKKPAENRKVFSTTNDKRVGQRKSSSPHCFRGVKGRLTGMLVRGRLYQGLSNKNEKVYVYMYVYGKEKKRENSTRGLKRGRSLERCGVFRKCKCQVNSSSEQPFSTRGGSRPL